MREFQANPVNANLAPGAARSAVADLRDHARTRQRAVVPLSVAGCGIAARIARGKLVAVVTDGALRREINRGVNCDATAIANPAKARMAACDPASGVLVRLERRRMPGVILFGPADNAFRVGALQDGLWAGTA